MSKLKTVLACVLLAGALLSCRHRTEPCMVTEQPLEEVLLKAGEEQKYLCILLIDSLQHGTAELLNSRLTGEFAYLSGKMIFSIVDILAAENRWYEKWLCPVATPLACVFSPDGALLNLLPDLTYESFAYMEKTVREAQADSEYHCYNRFGMSKNEYVAAMNSVLQAKRNFDAGKNIKTLIDSVVTKIKYPYSLFLKLRNEEKQNDAINLIHTCEELLSVNSAYELLLYGEELIAAKKILDPSYDIAHEPYLEVSPAVVEVGRCEYRARKPFYIVLKNAGNKPVKIVTVKTSCSCVAYLGSSAYEILPHDSIRAPFEFAAEQKGHVERGCYFVSNARNPVVDVKILATVE